MTDRPKPALSHNARNVLEVLVQVPAISKVSYYHPEKELYVFPSILQSRQEIQKSLTELDKAGVLKLNPQLKFGMWPNFWPFGSRCGYEVNRDAAKALYSK